MVRDTPGLTKSKFKAELVESMLEQEGNLIPTFDLSGHCIPGGSSAHLPRAQRRQMEARPRPCYVDMAKNFHWSPNDLKNVGKNIKNYSLATFDLAFLALLLCHGDAPSRMRIFSRCVHTHSHQHCTNIIMEVFFNVWKQEPDWHKLFHKSQSLGGCRQQV